MVSDGVLDALPGDNKEVTLREFLESVRERNPQEMADEILEFAKSFAGGVEDDMTALVGGIYRR